MDRLTKQRRPADVMPALSGRWLGKLAKLGQIAVMQLLRKSPAWTQRMAVHMAATNALIYHQCLLIERSGWGLRVRSRDCLPKNDHRIAAEGAEHGANQDWKGNGISSSHLTSQGQS